MSFTEGITIGDITRILLNGGDVSSLVPVLTRAADNPPVDGLAFLQHPTSMPEATALLEPLDSGLALLVKDWAKGKKGKAEPSVDAKVVMVGLSRYGPNIGDYVEELIEEVQPDIVTLDVSSSALAANMLYAFGLPGAVLFPLHGESRDAENGQLYTAETFYPGGSYASAILKCWMKKIPLVPVGMPDKPIKTMAGIENGNMAAPSVPEIYGVFNSLLQEIRGLKGFSALEQNHRICERIGGWLKGEYLRKQISEAGHNASRIADITSFSKSAGKKQKILSIVDIKLYDNAQYALNLLKQGIGDEVYTGPKKDFPPSIFYTSYSETLITDGEQYMPDSTTAHRLFENALENFSREKEEEPVTDSEVNDIITSLTARTRNHPDIVRGASVRGSIALKEVLQGYAEMKGKMTLGSLKKAALFTITPRITLKNKEDKSDAAIIEDIIKEMIYGISFSGTAFRSSLANEMDWLSSEDLLAAFQDQETDGVLPAGTGDSDQNSTSPFAIADPDSQQLGGEPDFNNLQPGYRQNEQASATARAIEYLIDKLEEKLANGEISEAQYQREKHKLQGMLEAANYLASQTTGAETAKTIFEMMDAQDKHWGKKLSFEDMNVYYHIKGTSANNQLSPPKQGYYKLRVLIDNLEHEGVLKPGTQEKTFSLTAEALTIMLNQFLPKTKKGRELSDTLSRGKAPPGDIKYDIQRYSPGNVFRDISVRHTLKEIARRKRKPSEIQRRDLRVYIRQPRKLQSDIILCMDTSGSMGYRHKLTYARLAAASLVRSALERGDRVGIIDFDDLGKTIQPLSSNKGKLMNGIAHVNAGGNTNIGDGLESAAKLLLRHSGQNEKHIVLITDGQPSALSRHAMDELKDDHRKDLTEEYAILETKGAARKGITTSVIHILDDTEAGSEFVKSVARVGKGEVAKVRNPGDLRLTLPKIGTWAV